MGVRLSLPRRVGAGKNCDCSKGRQLWFFGGESEGLQRSIGRDNEQRVAVFDRQPRHVCDTALTTQVSNLLAGRQLDDPYIAVQKQQRQPRPFGSDHGLVDRRR